MRYGKKRLNAELTVYKIYRNDLNNEINVFNILLKKDMDLLRSKSIFVSYYLCLNFKEINYLNNNNN